MISKDEFYETIATPDIPTTIVLMKTARVERISDNGSPILVFDGEETPSQQEYDTCNPAYVPTVGDRVVLLGQENGVYFIFGAIRRWANAST